MTTYRALLSLLAALAILASCEVEVDPSEDAAAPATHIEGTVSVAVDQGNPYGPAVLFRWSCEDPPPPLGAGRPVDFLVLPEEDFAASEAPFVFPSVPPETCSILGGFIDRDRNFHYAFTVTGQATQGDVSMAFVTVETGAAEGDWIEPVTGVELEAATVETHDRPSFDIDQTDPEGGDDDDSAGPEGPLWPTITLDGDPDALQRNFFDLRTSPAVGSLAESEDPVFKVILGTDEDGDGEPDDDNGDGVADVDWPRVLVFRLDPDDPTKLSESDPRVVMPGVVVPFDPFNLLAPGLLDEAEDLGIPLDGRTPLLKDELIVAVPDLVITSSVPLVLTPIEEIRAAGTEVLGEYRFLVMNPNGQLWYTPNEMAGELVSQGAVLTVTE